MSPLFTIRKATPTDVSLLTRIIRESFKDVAKRFSLTSKNCPKHPSNTTTDWIKADFDRGVSYFILEKDGQPIGSAGLEHPRPSLCYLERLAVLPAYRNQGFGHALARHVMAQAKAAGAKQVSIGIIADQTELQHWYADLGFVNVKTQHFPHLPFKVRFMVYRIESDPHG